MKIGIGSDHAGFILKKSLIGFLTENGHEVVDYGTFSVDRVDYPDYALIVSKHVVKQDVEFGILICGTGIGMSIAANKVRGIRAALVYDELTARLAKEHNHANIICIGERTTPLEEAKLIVDTFIKAHRESRHETRIGKIAEIEKVKN